MKDRRLKMSYTVNKKTFEEVLKKVQNGSEGLVLYGTGGDVREWIDGVTGILFDEGIAKFSEPEKVFAEFNTLKTLGGRTDTVMWFSNKPNLNVGKLALWRLRFGDASWASDYVDNRRRDFGYPEDDEMIFDDDDEE